jgi:Ca2+-binding RTX toxin-like protein
VSPGCDLDENYKWVACKLPISTQVVVDFGDGNDQLERSARAGITTPLRVDGGPGADDLRGNDGNDVLDYQDGGPDSYQGDCGEGNDVLKVDAKGVDYESLSDGCETIEAARALGGTATGGFDDTSIKFVPEPGVDHDLVISQEGDALRMTDPAGIVVGIGCMRDRPGDNTTVLCPYAKDSFDNRIDLGDGNDRVRFVGDPLHGAQVAVNGGEGNDTIEDGPNGSVLDGGPGDDVLSGAGGYDDLRGGAGNDRLTVARTRTSSRAAPATTASTHATASPRRCSARTSTAAPAATS